MDSSNLYLENLHFIKVWKVKTIKWVDIESLHDFIEIWNSNRCAWLNFEQFSGHITCIKCTSLHWHCKWIEWKSSLTFVDWCVWTWHLYLQSVHSVSVDLAMRSRQVSLWLVIYWPWDYMQSWMGVQSLPMCEIDFITLSSLSSSQKHDVRSNFVNWIENLDAWLWEYLLIISTTLLC